jgi:ATP-binding cassette, subfamily B, bacterial
VYKTEENNKESKGKLSHLWQLMEGKRSLYASAIGAEFFATGFAFLVPLVIRFAIDSVIGEEPFTLPAPLTALVQELGGRSAMQSMLWMLAGIIVILVFLQGVLTYLKGRWAATASESIVRRLRDRLYEHLQHLPFAYHARAETGDLVQRCTSDVETIRRFLAVQVVEIGRAVIMLGLMIPIMWHLNPDLTLVAMISIPLLLGFAYLFFRWIKSAFQKADEAEGALSAVLQENLTGIRVVRAFARQEYEINKFEKHNSCLRDHWSRLLRLLAWYWSVSDFLVMTQIAAVLVVGTVWASQGTMTLGTLVVFVTYESMLLFPVRQLGRVLTDLGKTFVSLGRVWKILDEPREDEDEIVSQTLVTQDRLKGMIEFSHLDFGYEQNKPVLKDISFRVEPGQTVAILGPTGSGKSTLVNLLPRLYDYNTGSITIDGLELKEYRRSEIRQQTGIVLQEPFLYSGSLKENLRSGKQDAEDTEIYEATRTAAVHDVILAFEKGYDTLVGERGVTLSGGQKQRVAIARAILRDPAILILDDSLSAIDAETEVHIQEALRNRKGRATTFVIAHRLSTVQQADLILVLEEGRITQTGTHEELLSNAGLYQRLWKIQNGRTPQATAGSEV